MQAEESPHPALHPNRIARLNQFTLYFAIFAIVIMCISLSTGFYAATRPTPLPTPTETAVPTKTPLPTPTKTEPPSVRATDAAPKAAYLPGLTPHDVTQTFMGFMFQCGEPERTDAGLLQWTCTQETSYATSQVFILSRTEETVDQVTAVIKIEQASGRTEEAGRFLGQAAALGYTASEPKQATNWVRRKVPGVQAGDEPLQAVFGDVQFTLSRSDIQWMLQIGELPPE